jgi:hypothetical protein
MVGSSGRLPTKKGSGIWKKMEYGEYGYSFEVLNEL